MTKKERYRRNLPHIMNLFEFERTEKPKAAPSALRSPDRSHGGFSVRAKKNLTLSYILLLVITILFSACNKKQPRYEIASTPAFDQEYYQNALAVINETLDDNPENADAYFKKSRILLEMEEPKEALSSIDRAINLAGNNPDYSLVKIRAHAAAGEMPQAFEEAQKAIKSGNISEELYSIVAEGNLQNENFRQAIRYAGEALSLNPNSAENYFRKGIAYIALSDTAKAASNFLKSLEFGKPAEEVYATLVKMYVDFGNYEQAYLFIQQLEPVDNAKMEFQKARVLRKVGQPDSATVVLYNILSDSGKLKEVGEVPLYQEMKDLYLDTRIYDSALLYANKLLALNENDKEAIITMARVYDRRQYYSQAVGEYQRILEMDSTLQPQIHNLAVEELDELQRKIAYLQRRREQERLREQLRPVPLLNPVEPERNNN
jgi:tetratricopeptide (TPR) repeat protein